MELIYKKGKGTFCRFDQTEETAVLARLKRALDRAWRDYERSKISRLIMAITDCRVGKGSTRHRYIHHKQYVDAEASGWVPRLESTGPITLKYGAK